MTPSTSPPEDAVFRLFAQCIPVKGARRSTICDLHRRQYHFIPNGLYAILTELRDATLDEIKARFADDQHKTIDDYFTFLVDRELGFWCTEPERFPELDLTVDRPGRIDNAVIDFDAESTHELTAILPQLDALGCTALQVRRYDRGDPQTVRSMLDSVDGSGLRTVELIVPHHPDLDPEAWVNLCLDHQRLFKVVSHAAPRTRRVPLDPTRAVLHEVEHVVEDETCCGEVHPAYFAPNDDHFAEAQQFNTCLNRKISVDARGRIRNCPALPAAFGHVSDTPLADALDRPGFTEYWDVSKDDVDVCRDCEFRYVCTDCRAFTADPDDPYSKPVGCSYDPYTATWGDTA